MIGTLAPHERTVTVIGAGMAGLLAAWQLDRLGYTVTLREASSRSGGMVQTKVTPFGLTEAAAHTWLVTPELQEAMSALHVQMIPASKAARKKYIYHHGRLRRFPLGFREALGFLRRVVVPQKPRPSYASLQTWGEHHLGPAATRLLLSPIVAGIYGARPSELAVEAAFPKAFAHGLRGLFGAKTGQMCAPSGGMQEVVDALTRTLKDRLGQRFQFHSQVTDTEIQGLTNVVLAVPTLNAAELLQSCDPVSGAALKVVPYAPLLSATVFVRSTDFRSPPVGTGVLLPESDAAAGNGQCLGILFNSSSFPHKAAAGIVSLTVMLGGTRDPEALSQSDDVLKIRIQKLLTEILGLSGPLQEVFFHRWKRAIPLYGPDLLRAWAHLNEGFCSNPGRVVFGNFSGEVSLRGMLETVLKFPRPGGSHD